MDSELREIRPLRKRLGLTQHQVAQAANLSQSLIAKVEAGLVDPSFTSGKKLLETLRTFERTQEPRAKELMEPRAITVRNNEKLSVAVKKMQAKAISQFPVIEGKDVVGLLTEKVIVQNMGRIKEGMLVEDIMEEAPPTVTLEAPRKVLAELLSHYNLVLVKEKGKVKGIITKADLLKTV